MKKITDQDIKQAADDNACVFGVEYDYFSKGAKWMQEQLTPEWIPVTERLPEEDDQLVKRPDEDDHFMPLTTKKVLVLTDMGTVINNHRVKMMIGEKEWRWFMGLLQADGCTDIFDGETITHWTYLLPKPPKNLESVQ